MGVIILAISRNIKYDENRDTYRFTQLNKMQTVDNTDYFTTITIEKPTLEEAQAYQESAFSDGVASLYNREEE